MNSYGFACSCSCLREVEDGGFNFGFGLFFKEGGARGPGFVSTPGEFVVGKGGNRRKPLASSMVKVWPVKGLSFLMARPVSAKVSHGI